MATKKQTQAKPGTPHSLLPETAFNIMIDMGEGASNKTLHAELKRMGHSIAMSTINNWSRKHNWVARREAVKEGLDPGRIDQRLQQIMKIAKLPPDEVLQGTINSVAERLDEAMRTEPPEHALVFTEVLERVVEVKAKVRGVLLKTEITQIGVVPPPEEQGGTSGGNLPPGPEKENGAQPASDDSALGSFQDRVSKGGNAK